MPNAQNIGVSDRRRLPASGVITDFIHLLCFTRPGFHLQELLFFICVTIRAVFSLPQGQPTTALRHPLVVLWFGSAVSYSQAEARSQSGINVLAPNMSLAAHTHPRKVPLLTLTEIPTTPVILVGIQVLCLRVLYGLRYRTSCLTDESIELKGRLCRSAPHAAGFALSSRTHLNFQSPLSQRGRAKLQDDRHDSETRQFGLISTH